jgi:hypothetical protein
VGKVEWQKVDGLSTLCSQEIGQSMFFPMTALYASLSVKVFYIGID